MSTAKSAFEKQNLMAEDILTNGKGKVITVRKATHAGETFSLLKKGFELGQKAVIVAPYKKIFDATVDDVVQSFPVGHRPKVLRILANKEMCKKVHEKITEHPELEDLSFHIRPSCEGCEFNDPTECILQEALACDDWNIIGITYAKLKL